MTGIVSPNNTGECGAHLSRTLAMAPFLATPVPVVLGRDRKPRPGVDAGDTGDDEPKTTRPAHRARPNRPTEGRKRDKCRGERIPLPVISGPGSVAE